MQIIDVEHVPSPKRGRGRGDWRKLVLMREAFWILKMNTRCPGGLNLRSDLTDVY